MQRRKGADPRRAIHENDTRFTRTPSMIFLKADCRPGQAVRWAQLRLSSVTIPLMPELQCLSCGTSLHSTNSELTCTACDAHIPKLSGIPDFLPNDTGVETDYKPTRRRPGPLTEQLRVQAHFDVLRQHLHEHMHHLGRRLDVVDIGCGTRLSGKTGGRHFQMLLETSRSYTGIEPSSLCITELSSPEACLWRLPDPVLIRSSGEEVPLEDACADVVLVVSVLDHCIDPDQVLNEIQRILRPGGHLLLVLGNEASWQLRAVSLLAPRYAKKRREADHHTYRFSPQELEHRLTERHFFELVMRREFGYFTLPSRLSRLESLLWPSSLNKRERPVRLVMNADRWLERHYPGRGSLYLIDAQQPKVTSI